MEIKGCIVTTDAMGCQKAIAKKIVEKGGDYVLALKGNQESLHDEVVAYFEAALKTGFAGIKHDHAVEENGGHGRLERRETWCTSDVGSLASRDEWKHLRSIAKVTATRTVNGKEEREDRHYISSLAGDDAARIGAAVRRHWGIENSLHWVLDVAFREDDSRTRKDNAPQNLATLRHVAVNLLKNEKTARVGVKNKRLRAGWDEPYLLKVLGF